MASEGNKPRSEEEWRAVLSPEQFRVLRQKGTELEILFTGWLYTMPSMWHQKKLAAFSWNFSLEEVKTPVGRYIFFPAPLGSQLIHGKFLHYT